jgi:spore maturation protein CgeB
MQLSKPELEKIAEAARERVLTSHTAAHRAAELERIFNEALSIPVIEEFNRKQMVAEA